MCQLRVILRRPEQDEEIARDVATLKVDGDRVILGQLFEEPKVLDGVMVADIDSLAGTVVLQAK